jgi:hypothetical protein
MAKRDLFGDDLDASGLSLKDLHAQALDKLRGPASAKACYIRNFPTDSQLLTRFLSLFGDLLSNYDAKSAASDPSRVPIHPAINRVRYLEKPDGDKFAFEEGGPLRAHSARSWRHPRPPFFAMLMVDPGWQGGEFGTNGESIAVRWRDALRLMETSDPGALVDDLALLAETPLEFQANHVIEPTSTLPLLYPLADAADHLDVGARLKQDILQKLKAMRPTIPRFDAYRAALERFCEAANDQRAHATYQMLAGDLVILDNNRFGHGRRAVLSRRDDNGRTHLNPREIWSVAIG